MQNVRYLRPIWAAIATSFIICGCNQAINPNQGFTVTTSQALLSVANGYGPAIPLPDTEIQGTGGGAIAGSATGGSVNHYATSTNAVGSFYLSNGIAPALWDHAVFIPPYCAQYALPPVQYDGTMNGLNVFQVLNYATDNLSTVPWLCGVEGNDFPEASSRFAIAGSLPGSVTLSALEPFTTQYGLPLMYVYSGAGGTPSLYTTITASSVSPDGSSASFPSPSSLPQNGYGFATVNAASGGGYKANSFNYYSVAGSQTISGSPFGVAVAGQTYGVSDRDTCDRGQSSYSEYQTFPVYSLYSQNAVSIGGAEITVGLNPTAVVTYNGPVVDQTSSDDCDIFRDSYSGMTRAFIANSGSNTVTILDIVNDVALFNVVVGNQPVALAASSDGSTGYVANYTDSTITSVNLSAGTATTTVHVGGHPTSVALTSGGILWVGGSGFLTEINTQNMTVTATESISGKTIIGLGYSDSVGQIVATSVDGSGNVYADQISPSSVHAGGTYQPVASNLVSSMGTHFSSRTNSDVRSFTATLASSPVLNVNQPGAPPLVVQDGWAVVTAIPTGFTITDITGNLVLMSETTPSPVAAIAVDPNLNVVYLTMPDSNTLLTVPLPGTNSSSSNFLY